MARADRGPLLSSLVLVGLATVATGALVLIGIQAGKISFNSEKAGSPGSSDQEEGNVVEVDSHKPTPSPRPSDIKATTAPSTAAPRETDDDGGSNGGSDSRTPVVTRTTATTQPRPTATSTTSKPATKPPTASPSPQPSQSTATTRPPKPSPSPSPSPSCTATDRSGRCKQGGSQESAAAAPSAGANDSHGGV